MIYLVMFGMNVVLCWAAYRSWLKVNVRTTEVPIHVSQHGFRSTAQSVEKLVAKPQIFPESLNCIIRTNLGWPIFIIFLLGLLHWVFICKDIHRTSIISSPVCFAMCCFYSFTVSFIFGGLFLCFTNGTRKIVLLITVDLFYVVNSWNGPQKRLQTVYCCRFEQPMILLLGSRFAYVCTILIDETDSHVFADDTCGCDSTTQSTRIVSVFLLLTWCRFHGHILKMYSGSLLICLWSVNK